VRIPEIEPSSPLLQSTAEVMAQARKTAAQFAGAQLGVRSALSASCAFGFFVPLMVFGLSKVAIALTSRH
jgi:hypothetical protein